MLRGYVIAYKPFLYKTNNWLLMNIKMRSVVR
nr:MAG TPA: hypothetical protein [Caudoviricetes sp.]